MPGFQALRQFNYKKIGVLELPLVFPVQGFILAPDKQCRFADERRVEWV